MNAPDRPDRTDMLADAMAHLIGAMRLMDANQQRRDQVIRELTAQIQENQERIREILGVLTQMQADIARLDS